LKINYGFVGLLFFVGGCLWTFDLLRAIIVSGGPPQVMAAFFAFFGFLAIGLGLWLILDKEKVSVWIK
jgi:hypothetical protein